MMKNSESAKKLIIWALVFALSAFIYIYFVPNAPIGTNTPSVVRGMIDLTGLDLTQQEPVILNGEWEFYENQLLDPGDFSRGGTNPKMTGYIKVPMIWKGQVNGVAIASKGCATYRMMIIIDPSPTTFGIKVENIRMGHHLFVNGLLRGNSGHPSTEASVGYVAGNTPYTTYFTVTGDKAELIIQVANYSYINSGIALPIYFGSQSAIQKLEQSQIGFELIVFATMFCVGFYHIGIYFYRRQETSLLWFGFFCLCFSVIELTHGQKLITWFFPQVSFENLFRIGTMSIFLSVGMMALFLKNLMSDLVPAKKLNIVATVFIGYSLLQLIIPMYFLYLGEQIFLLLTVVTYIFYIGLIIRLYIRKCYGVIGHFGIIFLLISLLSILGTLVVSYLHLNQILASRLLADMFLMICAMSMSYMLALRFSVAYAMIEVMSSRLMEQDKRKDSFLANTSHEFKTPLHAIINIVQSMLDVVGTDTTPRQRENLSLIMSMAKRLSSLVNDILDFEKIKYNELILNVEAIKVQDVTNIVCEVFHYIIQERPVVLINRIPIDLPFVLADDKRLSQIIYNLISNAVKFTEQGEVLITAKVREDRVYISIIDTGIGIAHHKHEDVFRPYEQVYTSQDALYGGSGLGLAICRQLIEMMDGKIWIEHSEPGQGTRVTFTLPLAMQTEIAPDIESVAVKEVLAMFELRTVNEGGEFTILVVDDQVTNLQVVINIFAQENYNIITALNGANAQVEIRKNRKIDLVLLDVMMPGISGYEVCRQIREKYSLLELPVLLLTVCSTPEDMATGFAEGANDFVVKPFDAVELRARVKTLLTMKKAVEDVVRTEVAFLQSQIKPHFFYNVLNTIMSLCYTDNVKAGALLAEFSNYLRYSFDIQDSRLLTNLEEELKLVESYVNIEQARFGERLEVRYEIDPQAMSWQLPPLIIQPLVENAVRHGLMKGEEGGNIRVIIRREEDNLVVEVADDGVGIAQDVVEGLLQHNKKNSGVGLRNINRRLLSIYGSTLHIVSKEGKGTTVLFKIPWRDF